MYLFLTAYLLLAIPSAAAVLRQKQTPVVAIAWLLAIVLLPIGGSLFYLLAGYRKPVRDVPPTDSRPAAGIERMLWYGCSTRVRYRNRVEQLHDGGEAFAALISALQGARRYIHLSYYIFADDRIGHAIADILVRKARAGVEVRLLYDAIGSWKLSERFVRRLRGAGIEVRAYAPLRFPWFSPRANRRNHSKIAVIDGCVGFLGGMNIADRYVRGTRWGTWRDTHFRIEGSGAAGLQASFLSDWSATTKQQIAAAEYYPPAARFTDNIMQIVSSGPFGKWRTLLQADSYAIARARRRVWIQTPYYLPSDVLNSALQEAALAGIDVRLMLPARSDSKVVDLATHSYLDDMMKAGVKILFYMPGFLHSKLLIIDDMLSVIGSANMDFRSFEHNFEVNAFVYDGEFTARMASVFEEDQSRSHPLTPAEWFRRPRSRRVAESLMRVFSPLL